MAPPDDCSPDDRWLDWLAIGTSLLCLAHCLALPLLVIIAPSTGMFAGDDRTHVILLALAVPVSLWALGRGAASRVVPIVTGLVGLALMTVAVFGIGGLPDERWLTVAGVVLVAAAHVMRWRSIHRDHGHRMRR